MLQLAGGRAIRGDGRLKPAEACPTTMRRVVTSCLESRRWNFKGLADTREDIAPSDTAGVPFVDGGANRGKFRLLLIALHLAGVLVRRVHK